MTAQPVTVSSSGGMGVAVGVLVSVGLGVELGVGVGWANRLRVEQETSIRTLSAVPRIKECLELAFKEFLLMSCGGG